MMQGPSSQAEFRFLFQWKKNTKINSYFKLSKNSLEEMFLGRLCGKYAGWR